MLNRIVKSSMVSITLFFVFMSFSHADEQLRIKILDRMTYTINPTIKLIGPVFRDQGDQFEKSKYATSISKPYN